jgi:serine phosphatase RsbU (regulator of sigma subunit)
VSTPARDPVKPRVQAAVLKSGVSGRGDAVAGTGHTGRVIPDRSSGEIRPAGAGFQVPAESAVLARLAAVTAELVAAESMEAVIPIVVSHALDAVHAAVSTLILRDGTELHIVGQHGVAIEKAQRWASFGVADENPASEAVRTGTPVIAATAAEVRRRYPLMAPDTPENRSVICLPLVVVGDVLGAIGLTFDQNWSPGPDELRFLMTFADTCAQAIRRVRATEEAAQNAGRLQFLARASAELASSLDYRATLSSVARLAVPTLGAWCAVDLLVDDRLVTLAVTHADPAKERWAWQLRERYPVDMSATSGAPNVARTGVSELYEEITDAMLVAAARDDEQLRLSRELQLRSVIISPLIARGRVVGVITLARTETQPRFSLVDLALAEDLGARAGVAVDNARLYDEAANVALELQRAVLPDHLDNLAGWETASHYLPDGNAQVGGDFFDAVGLPDAGLAVFIGDVMGHGIQAAATMAQMRAAVRAFLTDNPDPQVVAARLDAMFTQFATGSLVSLIYAVIRPDGDVVLINAGHLPPLHVQANGAAFVHAAPRPLLGARASHTNATKLHLEPGDIFLLYTDGLTERRGEPLDVGLDRLIRHSAELQGPDLDQGLADLADHMASPNHDDVAALAVRRGRTSVPDPGPGR